MTRIVWDGSRVAPGRPSVTLGVRARLEPPQRAREVQSPSKRADASLMTSRPSTPGSIEVTRALPIDAVLLEAVLLDLRRDAEGTAMRWTLGDKGVAEVETAFLPSIETDVQDAPTWSASARVWDAGGLVVASATVRVIAATPDGATITVHPSAALPAWWETRLPAFLDLLRAVLDEVAEELLWHATRDRISTNRH